MDQLLLLLLLLFLLEAESPFHVVVLYLLLGRVDLVSAVATSVVIAAPAAVVVLFVHLVHVWGRLMLKQKYIR